MTAPASQAADQRSIAIVSAAGEASADAVAAFVTQLGLAPSLHAVPQGGEGAGALESLEPARGAEYAVVLSPPDAGPLSPLQVGFLLGLVGRKRLCFLGSDKPGAAAGLQALPRHPLDEGGLWRLLLAREMKQAGLEVDLNRAM